MDVASGPVAAKRKTICMALYSLNVGGSEKLGLRLMKRYRDAGHTVCCVATRHGPGPLCPELEALGIETIALDLEGCGRLTRAWRKWQLAGWLQRRRVQALHVQHFSVLSDVLRAARRAAVQPIIVTEHTADFILNNPGFRKLTARIAARADRVVAINGKVRDAICEVAGLAVDNVDVIENGVDTDVFRPPDSKSARDRVEIVWLGRLHPDKDIETALRAFAHALAAAASDARLTIAGGGAMREDAERIAEELQLGQSVRFLGEVKDPAGALRQADIFFMSSRTEGTPLALLEAMASGLPAVSTDVGGIPETVTADSAILGSAGDSKALGDGLVRLIDSAELRQRMGTAARRLVEAKYSESLMADRYLQRLGTRADA